jgi:hypothetical protein
LSREILPGLILTGGMYDATAAGLTAHAPAHMVTPEQFYDPADWRLIPGPWPEPRAYKAERRLATHPDGRTTILNIWLRPDRRSHIATPHSHPWRFKPTSSPAATASSAISCSTAESRSPTPPTATATPTRSN